MVALIPMAIGNLPIGNLSIGNLSIGNLSLILGHTTDNSFRVGKRIFFDWERECSSIGGYSRTVDIIVRVDITTMDEW